MASATEPTKLNGAAASVWTTWLLVSVLVGMLILTGLVAYAISILAGEPFDPLGNYPLQEVVSGSRDGEGPPVLSLTDDVVVMGTKCNDTSAPVTVRGTLSWASIDPPGSFVIAAEGVSSRPPGCETRTFHNPVPEAVQRRMAELADVGYINVTWQINGFETPIAPDGTEGVARAWRTENFVLTNG